MLGTLKETYRGYEIYMFIGKQGYLRYYIKGADTEFTKRLHAKKAIDFLLSITD